MIVPNEWKIQKLYPNINNKEIDAILTSNYILDYLSNCKNIDINNYFI